MALRGFCDFEDESKIELLGADEDPEKYAQLERQVNEVILRQIPVRVYVTEEVDEKLRNTQTMNILALWKSRGLTSVPAAVRMLPILATLAVSPY